ncbi:MAG: hypothetical protein H7Y32_12845, partial [Chloroflexales bacterium]|nr:hypothetical protein [Chloroflexales bacterium]
MALNANSYGSVAGVEAYVAHLTAAGVFTVSTRPTLAQVEGFIDQMSARLNAWLAQAGYGIPVTVPQAVLVLSNFANLGAAGLAELTQRVVGKDADDVNRRQNKFLAEFVKAEADIKCGA